jgi:SAM-dependent methyltransferase
MSDHCWRFLAYAGLVVSLSVLAQAAPAMTRAECERTHQARSGQSGKDVIWVPTEEEVVTTMLDLAKIQPGDYVIDLGSGDGRIVIEAVRRHGVQALGVEYNGELVRLAQCLATAEGVSDRALFVQGDIFETDFSAASVLMMYLLPDLNLRLMPTILKMKPGTRVVSHSFLMGDWAPEERKVGDIHNAYLWIVPANAAGNWTFSQSGGGLTFTAAFTQKYQMLEGTTRAGGRESPITGGRMRGARIELAFRDSAGMVRRLNGSLADGRIVASIAGQTGPVEVIGIRN